MNNDILQKVVLIRKDIETNIHNYSEFLSLKESIIFRLREIEKMLNLQIVDNNKFTLQEVNEFEQNFNKSPEKISDNNFQKTFQLNYNYDDDFDINKKISEQIPNFENISSYNNIPLKDNNEIQNENQNFHSIYQLENFSNNKLITQENENENHTPHRNNHSLIEREPNEEEEKEEILIPPIQISQIHQSPYLTQQDSSQISFPFNQTTQSIKNKQNNIGNTLNNYLQELSYSNSFSQGNFQNLSSQNNVNKNNQLHLSSASMNSINNKSKQKASRVADILMKLTNNEMLNDIVSQIYGKGIFEELMSSKVDIDLIESLEKTIKEIETLEENEYSKMQSNTQSHQINNNNNTMNTMTPQFTESSEKLSFYNSLPQNKQKKQEKMHRININNLNNNLIKKYPKTFQTVSGTSNICSDFESFEKSLRKSNSKQCKRKTFINYTSPSSHYFDSSLQNGGVSKIGMSQSRKRSNNAISPVKQYIDSPSSNLLSFFKTNNYKSYNI